MSELPSIRTGGSSRRSPQKKTGASEVSWAAIGVIWALVVAVGMFAFLLRNATAKKKAGDLASKLNNPVVSSEADVLYRMYKENSVKADSLLKGRGVEVSGTVNTIGKNFLDHPKVGIGGGILGTAQCTFPKTRTADVAKLQKGGQVVIRGIVEGQDVSGAVALKDCRLVKVTAR